MALFVLFWRSMATVVMIGEAFFLFLISPHCRDCFNSVRNNNTNATVPYISRCFARPLPLLLFPSPHLMVVSIASTVPSPRCVLSFPSWCSGFLSLSVFFASSDVSTPNWSSSPVRSTSSRCASQDTTCLSFNFSTPCLDPRQPRTYCPLLFGTSAYPGQHSFF